MIRQQNNPRFFGYWPFGVVLLLLWLVCLIPTAHFTDTSVRFLAYAALGLLPVIGLTALIAELTLPGVRRVIGDEPLPPDADPVRLAVAEKLVEEGVLGGDPETNRLARIRADQKLREYGILFPGRTSACLAVLTCVQIALLTWWLVTDGISVDSVFLFFTVLVNGLATFLHPSIAARDRHRAESLRAAYDHHAAGGRER
ncbi:hypothetical protein [Nocardiopsis halotolerans]|uniref:hypothetical protein n=1 Tax=Nocardiopsis halotolerans TaxID=124252 RepID=UPI001F4D2856|nr:hypothetical protein [Nocardiopsis halotolerans]